MENEPNGGKLKTYKTQCIRGLCDEIVEVEEIGYLNKVMHVRCIKCGYEVQLDNLNLI
jgi:hypothetical protein